MWLERFGTWCRSHPRWTETMFAGGLGIVLGGPSLLMAISSVPWPGSGVLTAAIAVAHAALAARRAAPLGSFVVVCLAVAAQALVTGFFLIFPSVLVFPLSLYSHTAHGRHPALGPIAGAAGAALVTFRFVHDPSVTAIMRPSAWLLAALLMTIVVAAWSLGLFRRTQLAYIAVLEERAVDAAQRATLDERARIARDVHDVLAHSMAVIVSQAKGGQYATDRAPQALGVIEETGRQALTDLRGLVGVLSTGPAESVPQPTLRDVPELVAQMRRTLPDVTCTERGSARPLSPAAELAAYRIVQEALTNTLKHAGGGTRVRIEFRWSDTELVLVVRDDGRVGDCGPGGKGLIGMRERLAVVDGSITAGAHREGGFVVEARLPYPVGERS
ncbi:sensor histidine kinase [Saccharopolyspora shandongensis]|uniref:sensor histidine kinase n=1 Tax=Saccharopolyspora shandongensis TaxID=418495 RepID=UPI003F4D021D